MAKKSQEYELYLRISDKKDVELLQIVTDYLKEFPLFRNSKARLVTYEEYMTLVESKKISPPVPYWEVSKGKAGIVHESSYNSFGTTWDLIITAYSDFCSGYNAHKAKGR